MEINSALAANIVASVQLALAEDIGSGDITAQLIPADKQSSATIITREDAVVCGIAWVNEVFHQLDPNLALNWAVKDGDTIAVDQVLCTLQGNARALLTGERAALNFLQTLSGTATTSRHYAGLMVDAGVGEQKIRVLDTRKTLPGLRLAQKYAVKIGGCDNHRIGLFDAFLIKENHIAACGGIAKAVAQARIIAPQKPVEVEVESLDEYQQALDAGADRIMLDNFSHADIQQARKISQAHSKASAVELEVSGNIAADNIEQYQDLDIDFVSTGALTKHCQAVDYSMRIQ
ncbi:nicotinate-nucleotide diphosphorylase (carboxylating) [Gammaproteobacteria bacterium 53_120_T64]|nr:nicotinate-nucleotide diphosphorylase (carboxylating) [Gammaproteobacteria bacterium 53_120_T64]